MKKVIQILLICLIIIGTIVIATVGLNVGTKYSEHTQISINIGEKFEINDIKQIAKEVFKNKSVIVQTIELYEDMVQITVKEATTEEIEELNTKINEKYQIENTVSDIGIIRNSNVRLRDIVKPYILPISIASIIIILYTMVVYRKLGIGKVLYTMAINIVAPQAILISLYAITRLQVNRLTAIISIIIYIISITWMTWHLNAVKEKIGEKK